MSFTKLSLKNIRAFENAELKLSHGINILIGANNAGKSTVLLPFQTLQDGLPSITHSDVRFGATEATATFDMDGSTLRFFAKNTIDFHGITLRCTNTPDERVQIQSIVEGSISKPNNVSRISGKEPDNFIYPFLSKRKVVKLNERISETIVEAVQLTLENLNAKIDRLSSPSFRPGHQEYVRACEDILGFHVFTESTQEGKRAVYTVRNKQTIPLLSMGEGVMNILGLVAHLVVAENHLFLIEEPENDVHPRALKALMTLICEKAKKNQFIITTHSNIVLKKLGSIADTKVFEVKGAFVDELPTSTISEVSNTSDERKRVLESLGYELSDAELWKGWLLFEEASAEKITREYIIPWFFPELKGQLRTYSARSLSEIGPKFRDFNDLFVFLHLEPIYKNRSWVVVDAGDEEEKVLKELRAVYTKAGWDDSCFLQFQKHDFEEYYPSHFQDEVKSTLAMVDKKVKRQSKKALLEKVEEWIQGNQEAAKIAFMESALEVIQLLTAIRTKLAL